jgi:hypothetical protein
MAGETEVRALLPRTGTRNRVACRPADDLHAVVAWRVLHVSSASGPTPCGAGREACGRPAQTWAFAGEAAVRLLESCCGAPTATVVVVRGVPWWGVVSSAAGPVLMVAGWTVAGGLQPRSFDPVAQPVSALAAPGAADRWVMTLTFLVVGGCDVVTGVALRPARAPGRLILMAAAAAGILVAANPEHPGTSFPLPHMIWAAAGCAALVAWPAGAWRRGPSVPWGLRPAASASAVTVLLALLAWFGAELITGGGQAGLAERIFGAAQALWPLAVVVSCRHAVRTGTGPGPVPGPSRSGAPLPSTRKDRPGMRATHGPPGPARDRHQLPGRTDLHVIHDLVSPETHYLAAVRAQQHHDWWRQHRPARAVGAST